MGYISAAKRHLEEYYGTDDPEEHLKALIQADNEDRE